MRGAADDWRDCPRPDTRLPRPPRLAAVGGSERGTMTDHTPGAPPVIVLVRPQLGENIGQAARALLNFGLTELRFVAPRDGWHNTSDGPDVSGADSVIVPAALFGMAANT